MKDNDNAAVLATLRPALEPPSVADADAPVRACSRYPSNRPEQLDYKGALAQGLPIGSGEIESAHRYREAVVSPALLVPTALVRADEVPQRPPTAAAGRAAGPGVAAEPLS